MTSPPGPRRRLFDLWSHVYDLGVVQALTYQPLHDAVAAALRDMTARRLLDVGCGTGLLAARLHREHPDAMVVGCDFSRGMITHAAQHRGIGCVQGNALALPFRNGTFEVVVCTEAFHWFPDQPGALAGFFRVLAPGGLLLLALVSPPHDRIGDAVHVVSRLLGEPFYWPTAERLRQWLDLAGFDVTWQRPVRRLLGTFLLPPLLTCARRRPASRSSIRPGERLPPESLL